MGFFVLCDVCGNACGFSRYKIYKSDAVCCSNCLKKAGGLLKVDTWKVTIEEIRKLCEEKDAEMNKEHRMKCNVCKKVYCYTGGDIEKNIQAAKEMRRAAANAAMQSLAGTQITASSEMNRMDNLKNQIVDYSRCPFCNSKDVVEISDDEWQASLNAASPASSSVSNVDELKKVKELLDMGIITQEEFDIKKKQLLGL